MDVRNTLERLCVQLNMADTNMSAGESSCDEKHEKRKRKGKWNEENVTALIDLLEERSCLWNIFDSQYTKREKSDYLNPLSRFTSFILCFFFFKAFKDDHP